MSTDSITKAIIIGAGPAGLTAAFELITRANVKPIILEATDDIGGISTTKKYKGNRIDIGGHRFFSKSARVMDWWASFLPVSSQTQDPTNLTINYQGKTADVKADNISGDKVMLIRNRLSRILYMGKLFNYPISLSVQTIMNMGIVKTFKVGFTYIYIKLFPIKPEKNLEDFFINRFGKELYESFFKNYTHKVWGKWPSELSADWGAQRVKGLSIHKVLLTAIKDTLHSKSDIAQKNRETSLIQKFLYPKFGPGQMWETVSEDVISKGGEIYKNMRVIGVTLAESRVVSVKAINVLTNEISEFNGDYFFSTMPIKDLVSSFNPSAPTDMLRISNGLEYRDFITVGLLLNKFKDSKEFKDTWLYIHDNSVLVGRVQIFNNWSPYLVSDATKKWLGLEYFCYENDALWSLPDDKMIEKAKNEIAKIGIADTTDVIDAVVIRMPKTYPSYTGTYNELPKLRSYLDSIENLFLIGRNGLHRYNNQDHSMLTAMQAVDNIIDGVTSKDKIWEVNTEEDYHEEKSSS